MNKEDSDSVDWLEAELRDSIDEMVENELSEPMLSDEIRELYKGRVQNAAWSYGLLSQFVAAAIRADQATRLG